jgi:class IV lanthipeptide synthase
MGSLQAIGVKYDRALATTRAGLGKCWRIVDFRDGSLSWTLFDCERRPTPDQGWKIHVASAVGDSPALFDRVVPFLLAKQSSFKIASSIKDVVTINSGNAGIALIGKIVTVYPADERDVPDLANGLDRLWHSDRAPQILTDLQVRAGGSIYIRFGAFRSRVWIQDASGLRHPALRRPDGTLTPDERRLDGLQPEWATSPIPGAVAVRPQPQRELTISGRRYCLLGALQSAPKGEAFLAADQDLQTYVVKIGRRGVAEDSTGQDCCARLDREAQFLKLLEAHGFKSPTVHATTDDAIVMEDVDGVPLYELPRDQIGAAFQGLVRAVAKLHRLGIVHRDLKLSNALLAGGDIYLLDFELAAFTGAPDAPRGGTPGYIPPEGVEAAALPASDIYALGASLAHAALGVDPGTLVRGTGRLQALLISSGQAPIAKIVADAMNANPQLRPTAFELHERLAALPAAGR